MSSTKQCTFTTGQEDYYTYDEDKIGLVNDQAQLIPSDNAGLTFNEDVADDTDFTYESDEVEFTGGLVRQKDKIPTDATLGATFTSGKDAVWASGSTTGTLHNSAAVSGGKLDLTATNAACITFDDSDSFPMQSEGTLKFKFTPDFTGAPSGFEYLFANGNQAGSSRSYSYINSNGSINWRMTDDSDVVIFTMNTPVRSWVQDQEYELSFDYDVAAGTSNIFVNGDSEASSSGTGTKAVSSSQIVIGNFSTTTVAGTNGTIDDIMIFDTVQNTSDYTSGYTIEETQYLESKVELPTMSYSGVGSLQAFTSFSSTDTNSPRYVINDLYYNSGWVASSGTWATASTEADVLANIATLPASDTNNVDVIFEAGSTQMSLSDLTLTYTGQIYSTSDDIIQPINECRPWVTDVISFEADTTETGSDAVKFIVMVDGTQKYYSSGWTNSNGTYAQSNTEAEVATNIGTLITERSQLGLKIFLHSDDGSSTPAVDTITMVVDEALGDITLTTVDINGYIYDCNAPIGSQEVYVKPYTRGMQTESGVFVKYAYKLLSTTVADGFFSGGVILQPTGSEWEFKIGTQSYRAALPTQDSVDFNDLDLELVTED